MTSKSIVCTVAALGSLCTLAHAGTNGFYVPSFRGTAGSAVAGWERFTTAVGGNSPDIAGSTVSPLLSQSDPNALVTGSGNIYNMPEKSAFTIQYAAPPAGAWHSTVILQTRTAGTELDYSSVKLTYDGVSIVGARTELDRVSFGEPGQPGSGFFVSSSFEWNIAAPSGFQISFTAAEPSLSFDSATLDVKSIPEPSSVALATLGLATLAWAVRRKNL